MPTLMRVHTPSLPWPALATVQATQVSLQAISQQTPSTQWPDPHWFAAEHGVPKVPKGWQIPAEQI
jgi:hypothetical protein